MTMTARPDTRSEFRRHIDETGQLPDDVILGYIAWFGVSDAAYDGPKMEAAFDLLNLNKGFLPRAINPADAYEKASSSVEGVKYAVAGGNTAEIMVRELGRTEQQITRKLMREVRNQNEQRLLYDEVGELVFYKPRAIHGTVDFKTARVRGSVHQGVSPSERTLIEGLIERFNASYDRHVNFHDGQRVRAIVRQYVLHLNAIQMKPSVYFVHHNRADELLRLQTFVNGLGIEGTSMTLLPLADLPTLRTEVTEAFQREAEQDFKDVLTEITKVKSTRRGTVSMAAYIKLRKQFDGALDRAGEHARTFNVSQAMTAAASEVALRALNALQEEVIAANMAG